MDEVVRAEGGHSALSVPLTMGVARPDGVIAPEARPLDLNYTALSQGFDFRSQLVSRFQLAPVRPTISNSSILND